MIWGIICSICLILLLLKYIARKFKLERLNKILQVIHMPLGIVMAVILGLHIAASFKVWQTRTVFLPVTGCIMTILIVFLVLGSMFRKKMGKHFMKAHQISAFLLACVFFVHIGCYFIDFSSYQNAIKEIRMEGINVSGIPNGTYTGSYDAGYIYAEVSVTVSGGLIQEIKLLEHQHERGAKAEKITQEVVEKQATDIDTVSGATNSSKVILKAVEHALKGWE